MGNLGNGKITTRPNSHLMANAESPVLFEIETLPEDEPRAF